MSNTDATRMTFEQAVLAWSALHLPAGWIACDEYGRWYWWDSKPWTFNKDIRFLGMWNSKFNGKQVQLNPGHLAEESECPEWLNTLHYVA